MELEGMMPAPSHNEKWNKKGINKKENKKGGGRLERKKERQEVKNVSVRHKKKNTVNKMRTVLSVGKNAGTLTSDTNYRLSHLLHTILGFLFLTLCCERESRVVPAIYYPYVRHPYGQSNWHLSFTHFQKVYFLVLWKRPTTYRSVFGD